MGSIIGHRIDYNGVAKVDPSTPICIPPPGRVVGAAETLTTQPFPWVSGQRALVGQQIDQKAI